MKRTLFLTTHLGSGFQHLSEVLDINPRIQMFNTDYSYSNLKDLDILFLKKHKCTNVSAIYGDTLLLNNSLSSDHLLKWCKFVYLIRPAKETIGEIVTKHNKKPEFAIRYYIFRLQRIYQMVKSTPEAIFLTWQNLVDGEGYDIIEKYLYLKDKLKKISFEKQDSFDVGNIAEAENAYEKYLFNISKLPIQKA